MAPLLALAVSAPPPLATLDRRIAVERARIARIETPLDDLVAAAARASMPPITAERQEALVRARALLRAWGPEVAARLQAHQGALDRLSADRARLVLTAMLQRAGARTRPRFQPAAGCADAAWRLPRDAMAVTPAVAAALGRPRGLTLLLPDDAALGAPAGGRVAFAGRFRRYGGTVILHHGRGWTTLVTGLRTVSARPEATVLAGEALGRPPATAPAVTLELTRHGLPVDALAMARRCSR